MKKLIALLCVGLVVGAVAEVEYGYFIRSSSDTDWVPQSVSINADDQLVVLSWNGSITESSYAHLNCDDNSGNQVNLSMGSLGIFTHNTGYDSSVAAFGSLEQRTIIGPLTIAPNISSRMGTYLSYKIIRPDAVVNTSPMNIISLPDDNNGDVELLVESSTDLQNWTPVYSGSAGMSNNAAFFRTRLIQN